MIKDEDVFRIGRIGKPHGVKGEVSMQFQDDVFDRTECPYLILSTDGILVPFFIEEYRFNSEETALVKFSGIDTQQRAAQLTGCSVYFPRSMAGSADGRQVSWAEIEGYTLADAATRQAVGTIAGVDDTTINILFELSDGRLIPASQELINNIDTETKTIEVSLPEGLLDL